jgi:HK97 family phage major capsid protein
LDTVIQDNRLVQMKGQAEKLLEDARTLLAKPDATPEEVTKGLAMIEEEKGIKARMDGLMQIKMAADAFEGMAIQPKQGDDKPAPKTFKKLGEFLKEVYMVSHRGKPGNRIKSWSDPSEPSNGKHSNQDGWSEAKDLLESVGSSGGFLVPTEHDANLLQWDMGGDNTVVESRATVIPMRRRAITIPALNQAGTTAGQPHWYGGVIVQWTEEGAEKAETEPSFRQIELVAHKLACYTEASDELLDDSATSLEALLTNLFRGSTLWYRQNAYINGSGAGQPLGVLNAPATIIHPIKTAGALNPEDLVNMLEKFQGSNPVWFMNRRWLSNLMLMSGPSGNASFLFLNNISQSQPTTLLGYPLFFVEQMPAPGTDGSILLADWSKYLIGDRQAITIDSSKHFRFRNDITSWRCVSRVDGQPWLNAPLTWSDGTTQTSPFVALGATAGGS